MATAGFIARNEKRGSIHEQPVFIRGPDYGAACALHCPGRRGGHVCLRGLRVILREDGSAEVTANNGGGGEIVIPNELDGHPIMGIRWNVFSERLGSYFNSTAYTVSVRQDHPYLVTINGVLFGKNDRKLICYPYALEQTEYAIPEEIEMIGADAFRYCRRLTAVSIPDSVTSIGGSAFFGCTRLICVSIPSSVTSITARAFRNCTGLTAVSIPDSVTSIGWDAFCNCTSLTAVSIPDSVTSIGHDAFAGCTGLTSVSIPDSVTSIGDAAFRRCTGLTAVSIPDSVTNIGNWAFEGCTDLTLSVPVGSYAETYCRENNLTCTAYDPILQDAPTDRLTGE